MAMGNGHLPTADVRNLAMGDGHLPTADVRNLAMGNGHLPTADVRNLARGEMTPVVRALLILRWGMDVDLTPACRPPPLHKWRGGETPAMRA